MTREPLVELKAATNLVRIWNERASDHYRIQAQDLAWNFTDQNWLTYRTSEQNGASFIWAEASAIGKALGISDKTLWIPLWILEGREPWLGFLNQVESLARSRHKSRIVFGADEFHFLPGVPVDGPDAEEIRWVLASKEFQGTLVADLVGHLAEGLVEKFIQEQLNTPVAEGVRLVELTGQENFDQFSKIITSQFPGRWSREFSFWRSRSDTTRSRWLRLENSTGDMLGFSRISKRDWFAESKGGWTPGPLRLPLSESGVPQHSDCSLGPIGVWSDYRGKGFGNILLALTLQKLKAAGGEMICIDWTNAFKYYEPLGFQAVRQYWTPWKEL